MGTLKPLFPLSLAFSLDLVLERGFDIEVELVTFRAVVGFGFVVFLAAEGRGGLKAFGGILISF